MRYLIGLLITIAVIIFIIIRLLAGGGGDNAPKAQQLAELAATDTKVRLTIENPVQATETHREIEITVGRNSADFVLYRGYENDTIRSKTYGMNETSYADFLRSLQLSGKYTEGSNDASLRDERGYCATGTRYVYEIIDENNSVTQHYWSTSCGPKTFGGDAEVVQNLFQLQVPDYFDLIEDVAF
jgi:hypothetical protein